MLDQELLFLSLFLLQASAKAHYHLPAIFAENKTRDAVWFLKEKSTWC